MCDISKCLFSQSYHLCVCWLASFTWLRWSIFWPQVSVCWERRSQLGHQLQASLIHKDSGHWSDSLTCKICGDNGLLLGMCISDMSYLSGEILSGLKSSLTVVTLNTNSFWDKHNFSSGGFHSEWFLSTSLTVEQKEKKKNSLNWQVHCCITFQFLEKSCCNYTVGFTFL